MSPQRVKTYGWLFVAMSASVLANLLLFQSRPDAGVAHNADSRALRANAATVTAASAVARSADQVADTVRVIQRELNDLNLYPGQPDGKASPLVHAAIVAYEQAQALPITGEPTQALVRDLIVGPSGRAMQASAQGLGVVAGSAADRLVRDIRQKLVALGYPAGQVEGRLTVELSQGIRAFERENGMSQTGRVSAQLVVQLQRSAAAFKSRSGGQ